MSANAADIIEPVVIETPVHYPEAVPVKVSGWYIRGDVGYLWSDFRGADYLTYGAGIAGHPGLLEGELKGSFSVGGGVGYHISHNLRTDLTLDYNFKSDFHGTSSGTCTIVGGGGPAACSSTDTTGYHAWTLLANAYVDLGTYKGITPYVGAGVGGVYMRPLISLEIVTGFASSLSARSLCLMPRTRRYSRRAVRKFGYMDAICRVLGDYAVTLAIESFSGEATRGGGDATPDLARLPGARLVSASEPEAGAKLKEALIKTLTGGEKFPVRRLRKEFFEIDPQFKMVISGNHKPIVTDDSDGTCFRCQRVQGDTSLLVAHHKRPHRGDPILFWDPENLTCACKDCHDGPIAAEEAGAQARGEL